MGGWIGGVGIMRMGEEGGGWGRERKERGRALAMKLTREFS